MGWCSKQKEATELLPTEAKVFDTSSVLKVADVLKKSKYAHLTLSPAFHLHVDACMNDWIGWLRHPVENWRTSVASKYRVSRTWQRMRYTRPLVNC